MATDFDTARSQYENYRFCYDNGHQQWLPTAARCFDFVHHRQWDPAVKAQLEREGRPALTLNVIESLVRAMKGIQRALRNDVRFMPVSGASAQDARVRDAIWMHVQNQNALDFLETEIYEKGLIMGRAYYDVRVEYDEALYGHIKIRGRRSQDVVLDPSAETYDPDDWPQVYTRRWVSHTDIHHTFGKAAANEIGLAEMPSWYDFEDILMAQQMGRLPYYQGVLPDKIDQKLIRGHLLLERQYFQVKRKEVFLDTKTGDFSEIPETWDRDRISRVLQVVPDLTTMKRDVKTVRWTVTCEDKVLHDADSPYKHFTVVPFFPSFIDGVTMGAVESLIDPQQLYNKITSSELHIISTTANSGYKVKSGALKNMEPEELEQVGAKAGFVAVLDDINNLEKITPNQVPQGHDRLSFKADQIMRQLSGVSNQSRGFAREDVAGEAIMQNQAAQEINFAGWLSNLHRSKQLLARNVLDAAASHYTETRVLQINSGSVFRPQVEEVTINQPMDDGSLFNDVAQGKFSTVLVPAPARTSLSEADFKLLLELRTKAGIAIPDTMLIELSPASNKAQIIEMLSGGPDSNERARQAEALEAEQKAIDAQKAQADAANKQANASLALARAEKFKIEAASDPDASYERVEMARMQSEREVQDRKLDLDELQAANEARFRDRELALRLTELDLQREDRQADREAAQQERRPAARKGK